MLKAVVFTAWIPWINAPSNACWWGSSNATLALLLFHDFWDCQCEPECTSKNTTNAVLNVSCRFFFQHGAKLTLGVQPDWMSDGWLPGSLRRVINIEVSYQRAWLWTRGNFASTEELPRSGYAEALSQPPQLASSHFQRFCIAGQTGCSWLRP